MRKRAAAGRRPIFRLAGYMARGGASTVFPVCFSVLSALAVSAGGIAGPYLIGRIIGAAASAGGVDFAEIGFYLSILTAVYAVTALANFGLSRLSNVISVLAVKRMRRDAFRKLMRLPVSYLDSRSAGDLVSRFTNDIDMVAEGILQTVTQLITGISTIIGCVVMMIIMDAMIALAVIAVVPFAVLVSVLIAGNAGAKFRENQRITGEFTGYVNELIENQTVIKAFGYADGAESKTAEINSRLYAAGQKAQFYSSLVNPATRLIGNAAYVLIGLIGGVAAISKGLSVAVITSLISYSMQFSRPFNEMTAIFTQLQMAEAAAGRFFSLLDEQSEEDESRKPGLAFKEGAVEFRNVSFRYRPDTPLIENFSLVVPPRSKVAIVGPTGAGKSTLINLLMRFYETDGGSILIDGTDIRTVNRDSVRECFAMVLQETWLFHGSVGANIAFGERGSTAGQIEAAARAARADGFIGRLPAGYDTVIDASGNFSQGECQLLTVARAILTKAPMLIFDEATSSIDTHTERKIQKAVAELLRGRTSFIIAHRLSTVVDSDMIIVMKDGAIAELGTHDDLIALGGTYKELYESQYAAPTSAPDSAAISVMPRAR
jgi:ABC-type multidrug transport system fused ATPase/permease subunit